MPWGDHRIPTIWHPDQLRARGISLDQAAAAKLLMPDDDDVARFESIQSRRQHKTDMWFTDEQLANVLWEISRARLCQRADGKPGCSVANTDWQDGVVLVSSPRPGQYRRFTHLRVNPSVGFAQTVFKTPGR
jgi:hypothetical protein